MLFSNGRNTTIKKVSIPKYILQKSRILKKIKMSSSTFHRACLINVNVIEGEIILHAVFKHIFVFTNKFISRVSLYDSISFALSENVKINRYKHLHFVKTNHTQSHYSNSKGNHHLEVV